MPESGHLDWYIGMKVICIDASVPAILQFLGFPLDGFPLVEGKVYTISGFYHTDDRRLPNRVMMAPGIDITLFEEPGFMVKGRGIDGVIHDPTVIRNPEDGYSVRRFKPVERRKTDISIFNAMLTGRQHEPQA